MQVKITGEQPFQVLSTNFTIGPSDDGYDLMFSADGFEYSKLFTVGADTNRQVTQVAAGSYYFLSGNTGEVTINWMKDCGGQGGGGGSYILPTASENTLGGVKIGSGITIDENGAISAQGGGTQYAAGDGIEISGSTISVKAGEGLSFSGDTLIATGGGEGDYMIVDALSAVTNPQEGQMAQVRTEEVEEPYYKLYYVGNVGSNDYWGSIINSEDGEWGERDIYLGDDGLKFYWDWGDTNPRDWAAGEWNGATYQYRVVIDENDYANNEFHIKFPDGSPLELTNYADNSTRGTATGIAYETVYKYGSPYIYENDSWIPVYKVYSKSEIQAFSDSAQTAELMQEMVLMAEAGRAPMVYDEGNHTMMALDSYSADKYITFESDREGTTRFISLSSIWHDENDYDSRGIKAWDNGWNSNPEYIRKRFYVDSAGTLSSDELYIVGYDEDFTRILLINCPDGTGEGGDNTNLSHLEFRSVYQTLNENDEARNYYVIGGKIAVNVDGTLHSAPEIWEGVWGMMQDEWTPTTLSWTKLGGPYVDSNHPVYVPNE